MKLMPELLRPVPHLVDSGRRFGKVMVWPQEPNWRSIRLSSCLHYSTPVRHGQYIANTLNRFHLDCLRKILRVKWQDKIPDTEVLRLADLPRIHTFYIGRDEWHWRIYSFIVKLSLMTLQGGSHDSHTSRCVSRAILMRADASAEHMK